MCIYILCVCGFIMCFDGVWWSVNMVMDIFDVDFECDVDNIFVVSYSFSFDVCYWKDLWVSVCIWVENFVWLLC